MSGVTGNEDSRVPDPSAFIRVVVKAQDGYEIYFKIKKTSTLQKLMDIYACRRNLDLNTVAFLLNGRRLLETQTPQELQMEDGDQIDAMQHQTGGGAI